ncbi:hypothetical protein CUJ83_14350 [Methanocella sp. CWC-04]|uniref:Uncharacterized protein n=2 Tax=Methanooceanicella nereidis TaxID=2052831 RepID=A0AAP2RGG8_9EURY|nr:hypothetical protein [Methanocella sp. CWC-04]
MTQPAYNTGPFTTVNRFSMPLNDLSMTSGIGLPFGGISPFYSPYTYSKSYTRSTMGPEGPVTQSYVMDYDSTTGEQTVTYMN